MADSPRGALSQGLPEASPERSLLFVGAAPEDAELVRSALARARGQRYRVGHAATLAEARRHSEASVVDVVLLDAAWPECPGLPGVSLLRSLFAGASVILLLSEPAPALAAAAWEQGARDCLCRVELGLGLERLLRHLFERQATERQQQLYEAQLQESERLRSLGTLAAGIAHEINTPAQFIGDNLSFLARALELLTEPLECAIQASQASPEDLVVALDALRRSLSIAKLEYVRRQIPLAIEEAAVGVESIAAFVCSIAQYAQPAEGRRIPTDLTRVLDTSLNVTRNSWRDVAELRTEYAAGLPLVTADPSELTQVFVHLIVNAADALSARRREEKGLLTVGTRCAPGGIEAWVSDNGIGIPQEHVSKIFEPFFTTKHPGRALGRGLSVARRIIQKDHGGRIQVDSLPGSGSTFVISLPLPA